MFDHGVPQAIEDVLMHRDLRVDFQKRLLEKFPDAAVITFSLNIPGPIKNNDQLFQILEIGMSEVAALLNRESVQVLFEKTINVPSGAETFYVANEEAPFIKSLMIEIEENFYLGRLFDIDVQHLELGQVQAISRQDLGHAPRKCLICEHEAKGCARSREHSVAEMQVAIEQFYLSFLTHDRCYIVD